MVKVKYEDLSKPLKFLVVYLWIGIGFTVLYLLMIMIGIFMVLMRG